MLVAAIFRLATGPAALGVLVAMAAATVVLGSVSPKNKIIRELCGEYVSTDSKFFYSIECDEKCSPRDDEKCKPCVARMLARYDKAHFAAHREFLWRHDLFYPIFYAVPLSILLAYSFPAPLAARGRPSRRLVLLPLVAMLFDYAENFTVLRALDVYEGPNPLPTALFQAARVFTALKLSLLLASLLVLLYFVARALARQRQPGP